MIKKLSLIFTLILMLILVGCDYPEKSFGPLCRDDIPKEVTTNFLLPEGMYGKFIWTSGNEDVLIIHEKRYVEVRQQAEDVEVIVTARINKKTEDFTIKVLKIGSIPTIYEQSNIALQKLDVPSKVILPFQAPLKSGNIYFEYVKSDGYRVVEKADSSIWIIPDIVDEETTIRLYVKALYEKDDELVEINTGFFHIDILVDKENKIVHKQIFNNLKVEFAEGNSKDYVTEDFTLPVISDVNENATIKWTSENYLTIEMSKDGTTAHVKNKTDIRNCTLSATITIDEISYYFDYLITVHPQN